MFSLTDSSGNINDKWTNSGKKYQKADPVGSAFQMD